MVKNVAQRIIETTCKAIQNFCKYYEVPFTDKTRFTIIKRKFTDKMTAKDFDEDWQAEANYKGNFIMLSVSHVNFRDKTILASDKKCDDKNCDTCENHPCILHDAPKLPIFLKNLDLVCYVDSNINQQYGVFFGNMKTDAADDCAYLIDLYENALCENKLKTKDEFYERIFNLHEHIEFPRLEIAELSTAPESVKKSYKTFIKLYNQFKDYDN